jgi:parvulin-like peptidyl-prolyl isomerase
MDAMLKAIRRLSLVVLSLAAVAACQRSQPAPASASPDVWAVVDGRNITRDDVEKAYRRVTTPNQPISDDEATTAKLNLLDQLITQNLLLAKATELKIDVPDADVDKAMNDQKKDIPEDAWNKELTARSLSGTDMRDAVRRDMIAQRVVDREVMSKINPTDQDITAYYNANKTQFNLPDDAFHLTQIVVTSQKDAGLNNRTGDDAGSPQEALAKVQMITDRLKAGTSFAELAMDYSEEPGSAAKGGDVGLVSMAQLNQAPPKLRDAVLKAPIGSVSVVAMDGGYTIVGVVAKLGKGQRDPSMADVRNSITATLKDHRAQLWRSAYLEALRNKATVVNYAVRRIADSVEKVSAAPSTPSVMPAPPK